MIKPVVRRAIASAGALGGAVCMRSWGPGLPLALWLPALLLGASSLLVWRRHVGGQLLARAVLWSNLILGTLISVTGSDWERGLACWLATATGAALLALGRQALDEAQPGDSFVPHAFRGTLICLLVMAMADAQSLILFGAIEMSGLHELMSHRALPIVLAVPLVVSVFGLYRLRLWGLVLDLAASLVLALVSLTPTLDLPSPLRAAYVVTSAAQWMVALPLVVAILRRRAPVSRASLERGGAIFASLVIVAMMGASIACAWILHTRVYHY
jgi:hypothetical protein